MSIKQDRMAGKIRTILSELLLREVSDPALQHITITEVEIDPDYMYARIYVNALGDEARQPVVMAGLERAKGFLRRELGNTMHMRRTPELHFQWDVRLERGERINQLLSHLDIPRETTTPPKVEPTDDDD